ncbi:hypothetical protein ACLMJK_002771 [Lecanora helva]
MAKIGKTYFLAPTRDCPPSGPIALGNIIASPSTPEEALNSSPIEPLPPIHESYKGDWRADLSRYKRGKIGIWTKFLQVLGVGVDVSVNFITGDLDIYQFNRIDTKFFVPSREYVEQSVSTPEVQDFVAKSKFRANIYMITGIKIARGASIASSKLRDRGINLQFGIDGTSAGIPFAAGPDIELGTGRGQDISFNTSSDFVFAFRLREIMYSKKKGIEHREFRKGALFGLEGGGGNSTEEEPKGEVKEEFVLGGAGDKDVGADDVEMEGDKVLDDGEEEEVCECVVPDSVFES